MSKMLFAPTQLGELNLNNRMVMAPLTRTRAIGNVPNDLMATYYGQRATAGLIITEGTSPSLNGLGYPNIPGIFSQEQVKGWQKITRAVHDQGGKIFVQVMHTGRVSHPDNLPEGGEVLAPSAIQTEIQMYTLKGQQSLLPPARAMEKADIDHAIGEYVKAARNAIEAGFDGVELHGANGYLIEQFINPSANHRTDQYGGSLENRCRFALEVATQVAESIGPERVGIRLSPFGVNNDLKLYDEIEVTYLYLAEKLEELGLAYIHLVDHSSMGAPAIPQSFRISFRAAFNGSLILSGGYDMDRAEADLQSGIADLVAFGRPFIANPDLVERFKQNAPLNPPDPKTFYGPDEKGYTDYPTLEEVKAQ